MKGLNFLIAKIFDFFKVKSPIVAALILSVLGFISHILKEADSNHLLCSSIPVTDSVKMVEITKPGKCVSLTAISDSDWEGPNVKQNEAGGEDFCTNTPGDYIVKSSVYGAVQVKVCSLGGSNLLSKIGYWVTLILTMLTGARTYKILQEEDSK